ncbi:thioredoxin-like domain-containing protein [Leptospirillum ferriphilum]|uniref:thioredoxin-like domain-containing protein n=1 Tax=Leptospirillum ferriphilum TaxID=178606 RepID=UPI0006B202D2|nr:thioredoxin-like domain-containing protein [Leptospirillum ferriphilum]
MPSSPLTSRVRAPEFPAGMDWMNTDRPLSLAGLRGKVVLLDFWTFCCINCMHVLPDLAYLEEKYPDSLTVIGVHSAKFSNEGESVQIQKAIERYAIRHPVINDREFDVWNAYGAHAWPTFALIDPEGYLVGMTSGEGKRAVLDQAIDSLVTHHRSKGTLSPFLPPPPPSPDRSSLLRFPAKIDISGKKVLVSDSGNHRLLLLDWEEHSPEKAALREIIGQGTPGSADGSFDQAQFRDPQGIRFCPDDPDIAIVADTGNHLLRRVDFRRRSVTTIAGTGVQGWAIFEPVPAMSAVLNSPWDILFHRDGMLYVAQAGPHQIIRLDPERQEIFPVAGSAREDLVDGTGDQASLAQPSGLTSDGTRIYFVDSETSSVRVLHPGVSPRQSRVETLVGRGLFEFGNRDGSFQEARLQHPLGILWDDGLLLVADTYNHRIRALDPDARVVLSLTEGKGLDEPSDIKKGSGAYLITNTNAHEIAVLLSTSEGPVLGKVDIST